MTFQTLPVQITGGSYQSQSKPLSSQQTVNFYPKATPLAKEKFVLFSFPGLKLAGAPTGLLGIDRGLHRMAEVLYQVKGQTLYRIAKSGAHTILGAILGIDRCIMANDGINLFIVSITGVYQYNSDTVTISLVTDVNIVGAKSVAFINNQFIYTNDLFSVISNVGDGSTANGLNIIGEESLPDNMVRDYIFDDIIYRASQRSIVAWYNSGQGNPPIERLQGRIFQVGLAAINSIDRTDEAFYWLGDDFSIYQSTAGAKSKISTDAISNEIQTYSTVADAIANVFIIDGINFYSINFPSGGKTFVLNESLGKQGWFELSSGMSNGNYQGTSLIECYGKTFVADVENGNVYTLDAKTYTNNGETIKRVRTTGNVNSEPFGVNGKLIQMSKAKFIMESGVGLISGQGENPRIMVEYSDDGGFTFKHGSWPKVGRLGERTLQIQFFNLGKFYDRIFRISTTDPVSYSIFSATIDLRLVGNV
jgi:hypothetical protein